MDKFIVTGIPAFDGEYPVDITAFTMRELQIIKRMSGVRAGELSEAFAAGDSDVMLALAVIAVRRNGKAWEAFEQLAWEADIGQITFVGASENDTDATGDAVPLIPSTPNDSGGNSEEQRPPSGPPSPSAGDDYQETNLRAIGGQS